MLNPGLSNIIVQSDTVLLVKDPIVSLSEQDVIFLKEKVQPAKSIRLCMHKDLEDIVHEMLIIHFKERYIRPHRHPGKSVSYHIMEGSADMMVFNKTGTLLDVFPMGPYGSKRKFYYRIDDEGLYYAPLVRSDFLLFQEMIEGPFTKGDTDYASWAPEDGDPKEVGAFKEKLISQVDHFVKRGAQ